LYRWNLGTNGATRAGSSPVFPTILSIVKELFLDAE